MSAWAGGGEDSRMARRRSPEEIAELVAHYRNSGLTQLQYCEQHDVTRCTLVRYLHRHGGGQRLVRVRVRPEAESEPELETKPNAGFSLVLTNGRRIESGWKFSGDALAQLIRLAEAV